MGKKLSKKIIFISCFVLIIIYFVLEQLFIGFFYINPLGGSVPQRNKITGICRMFGGDPFTLERTFERHLWKFDSTCGEISYTVSPIVVDRNNTYSAKNIFTRKCTIYHIGQTRPIWYHEDKNCN